VTDYGHPITFGLSLDASVELLDQTKTLAHAAEDAGMESCASQMFGGRIALGVGGGASADGVAAMGGTRRNGRDMVSHTDKALQIMRRAGRGHRSVPQRPARDRRLRRRPGPTCAGSAMAGQPGAAQARSHPAFQRRLDLSAEHLYLRHVRLLAPQPIPWHS